MTRGEEVGRSSWSTCEATIAHLHSALTHGSSQDLEAHGGAFRQKERASDGKVSSPDDSNCTGDGPSAGGEDLLIPTGLTPEAWEGSRL